MSDADARGASKRLCRVKRPHPPLPGSAVKPRFPVLCRPQQPRQPHCCAGLSVRDRFLFGRRANTGIPFTGQRTVYGTYGTLRTCPHQNGQTSVAACRTADGGARYIVRATVVQWHRSTALECGLWCAWFAFLHITSPFTLHSHFNGNSHPTLWC